MKNHVIKLVWFTTLFVFIFAGLCQTNTIMPVIMGMFIFGNFLILFMVYSVLHDHYATSKTFKDWYEDHPIKTLDETE